jgi:hypothetical protein
VSLRENHKPNKRSQFREEAGTVTWTTMLGRRNDDATSFSAVGEFFSDFDFSVFFRKLLKCRNGNIDDFWAQCYKKLLT